MVIPQLAMKLEQQDLQDLLTLLNDLHRFRLKKDWWWNRDSLVALKNILVCGILEFETELMESGTGKEVRSKWLQLKSTIKGLSEKVQSASLGEVHISQQESVAEEVNQRLESLSNLLFQFLDEQQQLWLHTLTNLLRENDNISEFLVTKYILLEMVLTQEPARWGKALAHLRNYYFRLEAVNRLGGQNGSKQIFLAHKPVFLEKAAELEKSVYQFRIARNEGFLRASVQYFDWFIASLRIPVLPPVGYPQEDTLTADDLREAHFPAAGGKESLIYGRAKVRRKRTRWIAVSLLAGTMLAGSMLGLKGKYDELRFLYRQHMLQTIPSSEIRRLSIQRMEGRRLAEMEMFNEGTDGRGRIPRESSDTSHVDPFATPPSNPNQGEPLFSIKSFHRIKVALYLKYDYFNQIGYNGPVKKEIAKDVRKYPSVTIPKKGKNLLYLSYPKGTTKALLPVIYSGKITYLPIGIASNLADVSIIYGNGILGMENHSGEAVSVMYGDVYSDPSIRSELKDVIDEVLAPLTASDGVMLDESDIKDGEKRQDYRKAANSKEYSNESHVKETLRFVHKHFSYPRGGEQFQRNPSKPLSVDLINQEVLNCAGGNMVGWEILKKNGVQCVYATGFYVDPKFCNEQPSSSLFTFKTNVCADLGHAFTLVNDSKGNFVVADFTPLGGPGSGGSSQGGKTDVSKKRDSPGGEGGGANCDIPPKKSWPLKILEGLMIPLTLVGAGKLWRLYQRRKKMVPWNRREVAE